MKHLLLFNLFEQATSPMREMVTPFEKGLLAIFEIRKDRLPKMKLTDFPIVKGLCDTTSLTPEFMGNPPSEPMMSLRKKNPTEYKSNLFKCLVLLVGGFGGKDNNPIPDYKHLLMPWMKSLIPNIGEGPLETMITQSAEKLSTLDKSQGMSLLKVFKRGYGVGVD